MGKETITTLYALKQVVIEYLKELDRQPRDLVYLQNLRNKLKEMSNG